MIKNQKNKKKIITVNDVVVRYAVVETGTDGVNTYLETFRKRKEAMGSKKVLKMNDKKRKLSIEKIIFNGEKLRFKRAFIPGPRIALSLTGKPLFQLDGRVFKINKKTPMFSVDDIDETFEVGMAYDWINNFTRSTTLKLERIDEWF